MSRNRLASALSMFLAGMISTVHMRRTGGEVDFDMTGSRDDQPGEGSQNTPRFIRTRKGEFSWLSSHSRVAE